MKDNSQQLKDKHLSAIASVECLYHLKAKQQKKAAESQRNVYFSRSYLNITYLIEKKDTNNTQ